MPVSTFVQYSKMYLGYPDRNCVYGACLFSVINIEPDGQVLPCSRYSRSEYVMGNILNVESITELFLQENYRIIVEKSIIRRNKCKKECELYKYCLGGCSSACVNECGLENNNTQLCRITKALLPFVFSKLSAIFNEKEIENPILRYLSCNNE